jgi:hypothetical protein
VHSRRAPCRLRGTFQRTSDTGGKLLDPTSGRILAAFDGNAHAYRWWHRGPHTFDFTATLRRRSFWDSMVIVFLAGSTVIALTGVYFGVRRLSRDAEVLLRR